MDNTENKQVENETQLPTSSVKINTSEKTSGLKKSTLVLFFALTVFVSALFGGVFGLMSGAVSNLAMTKLSPKLEKIFPGFPSMEGKNPEASKQRIIIEDSGVIDVVKNSSPGVVSIIISKNISISQQSLNDIFGFLPAPAPAQPNNKNSQKQQIGAGSGFFISADGLILTNKHVVDDMAADYSVMTNDGKEYPAQVLARDPIADVAVIKIEGNNFPVLPLGDSDQLQVGQTVVAIGNSLGEFANSASRGIVSGLKRNIDAGSGFGTSESLSNIIQTDAAINPGNSGGPLIDIQGNVIGINVAIAQGAQNVGFALPINQAKQAAEQVRLTGKISVPFLGVRYQAITADIQKANNLAFDYGVIVLGGANFTDFAVAPGSPADKAGIVERDIILEVDGQKLDQNHALGDIIATHKVGDSMTLKIWHRGQTKDVQVVLEERKQ